MKIFTPQISWHNKLPALSLDISKPIEDGIYRLATGGNDSRVYIWLLDFQSSKTNIKICAGLRRHQRSVGAVKFSQQLLLASGDDDGYIYIWKNLGMQPQGESNSFTNDDEVEDLEHWQQQRVLRGHIEDICDLAWSDDGQHILSGSVDNSAILWDATQGTKLWCSDLIKGYVQGVAIDPLGKFLVAISSDRTLRVYNYNDKRLLYATRRMKINGKFKAFFCDDTLQTFCRRLEFSLDGQFLIAPTGQLADNEQKSNEQRPINATLIFRRSSLQKPVFYYPTGREVALCARFSPVVYKLRDNPTNFWDIPYRIVFAIATSRSVIIYDSQQPTPIGYISQIHLARLTDLAWSSDGQLLAVSSYDGYNTIITFENNEFGEQYTGELWQPPPPRPLKIEEPEKPKGTKRVAESSTILHYLVPKKNCFKEN